MQQRGQLRDAEIVHVLKEAAQRLQCVKPQVNTLQSDLAIWNAGQMQ